MQRDPVEFVNRLQMLRNMRKEAEEKNGWNWKSGISLYKNPEFLCPRCKTWDETGLIWLVDENRYQLLGAWLMNGKPAYSSFTYIHPHVSGSSICRGNANSAAAALFASIHPDNPYHDINTWLKEIGHAEKCSAFPRLKCGICERERATVYMTTIGYSSMRMCVGGCHEKAVETLCFKCALPRDTSMDERRDRYCEKCFEGMAYSCGVCSEKWGSGKTSKFRDIRVCPVCFETRKKRCGGCSKWFLIKDMDQSGRCLASCKKVYCNYCGNLTTTGERDAKGYCVKCQDAYKKPCSRCGGVCNEPRGYCVNCVYTCPCDCGCKKEVENEGYRCNACEEGDHYD